MRPEAIALCDSFEGGVTPQSPLTGWLSSTKLLALHGLLLWLTETAAQTLPDVSCRHQLRWMRALCLLLCKCREGHWCHMITNRCAALFLKRVVVGVGSQSTANLVGSYLALGRGHHQHGCRKDSSRAHRSGTWLNLCQRKASMETGLAELQQHALAECCWGHSSPAIFSCLQSAFCQSSHTPPDCRTQPAPAATVVVETDV